MRIATRCKDGVIRASICEVAQDGAEIIEIGTLNKTFADRTPGAFDAWVEYLKRAMQLALGEATGGVVTIERFDVYRPHDKN